MCSSSCAFRERLADAIQGSHRIADVVEPDRRAAGVVDRLVSPVMYERTENVHPVTP